MSLSEKQIQCIGLLASGMAQKEVAEALKTTPRTIQRWQREQEFMQALQASEAGQVASQQTAKVATQIVSNVWQGRDHLRQKELSLLKTLEDMLMICLQRDTPDFRAVDRLIKISERRSKLLGLEIRSLRVFEAVEILLREEILSSAQAGIVFEGIENIEQNLRIVEAQKQSPAEIQAIKHLSAEELAREFKNIIDESC